MKIWHFIEKEEVEVSVLIKKLIFWHYKLFREAEKQNVIMSIFNTMRNMLFGFYKKKIYVLKNQQGELDG